MSTNELQKLISTKKYKTAMQVLNDQTPETELDADKRVSNISYVHYLMGEYKNAKSIVDNAIEAAKYGNREVWPKLYYRLAKAHEGLQNYEEMCAAYENMIIALPEEEKLKSLRHMQDYYNRDVLFMQKWVQVSGGYINNVQVEYYDVDYRGMVVSDPIKPGEPIIKVPRKCVFSVIEAKKHNKYLTEIQKAGISVTADHTYLALDMIYTKKNGGPIMPYIRCLPKYFDNVPINFTIDELQYLEGSFAIIKIVQKLLFLKIDYDKISAAYPAGECPFSYAEFIWGRTAVITRVYKTTYQGQDDNIMAPFADMANHEIPPNTKWGYNEKTNMFVVEAEKYLQRGDVLYETYGQKSNYRYFVNYGFTVDNNRDEEAVIVLNPQSHLVFQLIAKSILAHSNKAKTVRDLFETELVKHIDQKLMEMIITEHGTSSFGYVYNQNVKKVFTGMRGNVEEPTSREQEISILEHILQSVKLMQNGFITTIEHDEELLRQYDFSFNIRNTIIVRKEEKKVLLFWKTFCESCIAALRSKDKNPFKRLIKKMANSERSGSFVIYLRQLEALKQ